MAGLLGYDQHLQVALNRSHAYYPELDSLRAIAILAVVVNHWLSHSIIYYLNPAVYGVELFFVLSGFLLSSILLHVQSPTARLQKVILSYFARRMLRIFPGVFLLLLLSIVFLGSDIVQYAPYVLTFTVNIRHALHHDMGTFTYLWTLGIEEQFYLLLPFLILFISTQRLKQYITIALCAIPIVYGVVFLWSDHPSAINALQFYPITGFVSLLVGVWYALSTIAWGKQTKILLITGGLLLFTAIQFVSEQYDGFQTNLENVFIPILSFSFVLLIDLAVKGDLHFLKMGWLQFIGRISYGMYIFHILTLTLYKMCFRIYASNGINTLFFSIALIFTLLFCSLMYYLVEKPILLFKNRFPYT